jgi:hypothetical protein
MDKCRPKGGRILLGRNLFPVWIGIAALSGLFLLGQETWPPPGGCVTDAGCDDGVPCNGAETCVANVCQAGGGECDDPVFADMTTSLEHRGPGTEVNYIVAHEGSLFATVSTWNASDIEIPITVLRKDAPAADWVTDFTLPKVEEELYTRAESMARLTFTTDYTGTPLAEPVTLLILGSGQQSGDPVAYPWNATVWTRVAAGHWERVVLPGGVFRPCDGSNQAGVRSLEVYHDPVLGRDILFIGQVSGRIHRAGYDPAAPGRLSIEPEPVFQGSGRVMSLRATPFGLFAAVSQKNLEGDCHETPGLPEGLIRYLDGTEAVDIEADPLGAFEHLDTWETDGRPAEDSCRGLTLLPHPEIPGESALFGGLEDPGHIVYWENLAVSPTRVLELDIVDYLDGYRGGDWSGVRIGPYNEFTLAADPATFEPLHLIGLYVKAANTDLASYFLVRRFDGSYGSVKIPSPDAKALRGTRTIVPSPWPEDHGRVFYFGGFDGHGGPHTATAWIVKGTIPE